MSELPRNSFFNELSNMYSHHNILSRGENSLGVAIKFFQLLESNIEDEEERKRLMLAWFKSVKDKNSRKFIKALRKYSNERKKDS